MGLITLRVLDGPNRGEVYESLPTPVTVGREEGNSIQLNDERVSRFHLKIQEDQDRVVLTDLESTNGTKVNGEGIQLRILRHGDMVAVGRSVMLYGSREQIAERLALLRGGEPRPAGSQNGDAGEDDGEEASLDFELHWSESPDSHATLHILEPPDLPERLSPLQAAQLSELLEYLHVRMRDLLASVRVDPNSKRITVAERQWQNLVDLQARIALYLRAVGEPRD
jgi:predicted component of type VI protein secretion system